MGKADAEQGEGNNKDDRGRVMNAMCKLCPMGFMMQMFFPDRDQTNKERHRACCAEKEVSRLSRILIEEGVDFSKGGKK